MYRLNNLKSPKGSHRNTKRIGRGQGSGQGTQAGKGDKGQKARSGGGVRPGFEGGQMPMYRRLPKKGFSNAPFKKEFAVVNIEILELKLDAGTVTRESLVDSGVLAGRKKRLPIKILGNGALNKAFTFDGISKFSQSAKEAIEKAGGKV